MSVEASSRASNSTDLAFIDPHQFRCVAAVHPQFDVATGRGPVVDAKLVAARAELPTGRRCAQHMHAVVRPIVGLVSMTEDHDTHPTGAREFPQAIRAIHEPDFVQPRAVQRDRRVMQVYEHMLGGAVLDRFVQALELAVGDSTACRTCKAAVDAGKQPVAEFVERAIFEWRVRAYCAHQHIDIVIARYAEHRQVECDERVPESVVGGRRVVLHDVAGDHHNVGRPAAGPMVAQHAREGVPGDDAPQRAVRGCEQVRVRQVQYAQHGPRSGRRERHLNSDSVPACTVPAATRRCMSPACRSVP